MTNPMPFPAWLEPLLRQLAAEPPAEILLVAPPAHPLAAALRARLPDARLDHATDAARLPPQRHALAVVAATLESASPAAARELLAALRDRCARHTLLWVDAARAPLPEGELRALGFRIHARDGTQLLCGFDLFDYKDRPDWLNPQSWAHPELWDRFRW